MEESDQSLVAPQRVRPGPQWWKPSVIDHREVVRVVVLRNKSDWFAYAHSYASPVPLKVFRLVWKTTAVGGILIVPLLCRELWRSSRPSASGEAESLLLLALFAVPLGFFLLLAWLVPRSAWAPDVAAEFLKERVCPCCHYRLHALLPDPDGCTVCPECGAAWKLNPAASIETPTNPK